MQCRSGLSDFWPKLGLEVNRTCPDRPLNFLLDDQGLATALAKAVARALADALAKTLATAFVKAFAKALANALLHSLLKASFEAACLTIPCPLKLALSRFQGCVCCQLKEAEKADEAEEAKGDKEAEEAKKNTEA